MKAVCSSSASNSRNNKNDTDDMHMCRLPGRLQGRQDAGTIGLERRTSQGYLTQGSRRTRVSALVVRAKAVLPEEPPRDKSRSGNPKIHHVGGSPDVDVEIEGCSWALPRINL